MGEGVGQSGAEIVTQLQSVLSNEFCPVYFKFFSSSNFAGCAAGNRVTALFLCAWRNFAFTNSTRSRFRAPRFQPKY